MSIWLWFGSFEGIRLLLFDLKVAVDVAVVAVSSCWIGVSSVVHPTLWLVLLTKVPTARRTFSMPILDPYLFIFYLYNTTNSTDASFSNHIHDNVI